MIDPRIRGPVHGAAVKRIATLAIKMCGGNLQREKAISMGAVLGCGGVELSKAGFGPSEKLSPQMASIVDVRHDESFKFRAPFSRRGDGLRRAD